MEIGIDNFESALSWYIEYISNGESILSTEDYKKIKDFTEFNHLRYLYSQISIPEFVKNNEKIDVEFCKKINSNKYVFKSIPNEVIVEIRNEEKDKKKYQKLDDLLKMGNIKLEKIVDIEFFEYYKSHKNYLESLNGLKDERILMLNNTRKTLNNSIVLPSLQDYAKKFSEMENSDFQDSFFGEDHTKLINYLDDDLNGLNKDSFTSFLDTEKIHIQLAICSKGNKKNVPILAYFGFGNYYPFNPRIKNKNSRFNRISQIDNNDDIDINYYKKELNKDKIIKNNDLKSLIDVSQQEYHTYFKENFDIEKRRDLFTQKYSSNNELPLYINSLIMLQPIWRNKFNSLIAYNYDFFN